MALFDKHTLSESHDFRARVRVALTEEAVIYLTANDTGTTDNRKKLRVRRQTALIVAKAATTSASVLQAAQLMAAYLSDAEVAAGVPDDARIRQLSGATFDAVANTEILYQDVILPA